jgi:hypothetical protein
MTEYISVSELFDKYRLGWYPFCLWIYDFMYLILCFNLSPQSVLLHAGLVRWRRRPVLELWVQKTLCCASSSATRSPRTPVYVAGTDAETWRSSRSCHSPCSATNGDQYHSDTWNKKIEIHILDWKMLKWKYWIFIFVAANKYKNSQGE